MLSHIHFWPIEKEKENKEIQGSEVEKEWKIKN